MSALSNHPQIEMLPLSALRPKANNARTHDDKQIQLIAHSISRFGFVVPLVVDDEMGIAAGHARFLAAKALGLSEVPCVRVAFVSEGDARAFALAENRLAELGGWDKELLAQELHWLFEQDYDISALGFSLADMDFTIGEAAEHAPGDDVEMPDADAVAVSQLGDLWHIGPHRLYCGNSLDSTSYDALLGEERAQMVFADPPYNVKIDGHVSGLGANKHREFAFASGEMNQAEFTRFLRMVFKQCVLYSESGSIHYQCMDHRHQREMFDAADGVYSDYKQLVVWKKSNAGMGAFYRSQHELIYVFKSGKGKHINNFGLGETGRYRTNVWDYAGANVFRKGRDADLADHPTVKPLALVMDAILDCSNRGGLILDPFSGSGTTLLAAHKTGRIGAAIELDPLYVDTALRRLTAASGLTATHTDGRSFAEVAAERRMREENRCEEA